MQAAQGFQLHGQMNQLRQPPMKVIGIPRLSALQTVMLWANSPVMKSALVDSV